MFVRWKYRIRLIAIAAVFAVLSGAAPFLDEPVANAQGVNNDYVDVGLILEVIDSNEGRVNLNLANTLHHNLRVGVVNNGRRAAYDVKVVVDVVYPEANSHFHDLGDINVPAGSASLQSNERTLVWTIDELGGLQREEFFAAVTHRDAAVIFTYDNASYPHEFVGNVTTSSHEINLHKENNASRAWSYNAVSDSLQYAFRPVRGNYTLDVSVDKPSPSRGETVNFTITAARAPFESGTSGRAQPIDLKVDIELTGGLTVSGMPSFTSFHPRQPGDPLQKPDSVGYRSVSNSKGVFTVGTLKRGEAPTNSVTLPVTVTDSPVVNGQCLTATLTGNPPPGTGPFDDDISDNVVKLCLGEPPDETAVIAHGQTDLFTWYDCAGNASYPCDNQDSLEFVVLGLSGGTASNVPYEILKPKNVVVHVADPGGRYTSADPNSDSLVWSTGFRGNPSFSGFADRSGVHLLDNQTLLAPDKWGVEPDGEVGERTGHLIVNVSGPGAASVWGVYEASTERYESYSFWEEATNGEMYNDVWYVQYKNDVFVEFSKLGTYTLTLQATAALNSDTPSDTTDDTSLTAIGTYTFHVGPVAELEVRDGGARTNGGQVSYTVEVVNNGPDSAVRAVVDIVLPDGVAVLEAVASDGSYSNGEWDLGALGTADNRRASGIPDAATLTLILDADPGDLPGNATATIRNDNDNHPYTVCIGSDGNDVTPQKTSEAACDAVDGASWHEGEVLDHNAGNNTATITARSGGLETAASTTAVVGVVLDWDPADDVNGLPVTEYQIHRQEDPGREDSWALLATVPAPQTQYVDTAVTERAEPYMYRVRAVNGAGIPGPWLITIEGIVGARVEAQSSEVSLALTPATIGEAVDAENNVAEITATLVRASGQDIEVTVKAEPAAGSGTEPEDFSLSDNNILTIPAGSLVSRGMVTVTANHDDDSRDERITIRATAENARGTISPLTLTIEDDDAPGLKLSAETVTVGEGRTADYTVTLNAEPSADVTVRLTSDNGDVTVPAELIFTPDNWDQPQTVTVSAAEDDDAVDDTATITHRASGAAEYRGIRASLDVTVNDNDTAGVTVDTARLDVTEGLGGKTYTVSLHTQPAGSVYITATSDNPDMRVSPPSFTLNSSNWRDGRTVTVSTGHDQDGQPDSATITHEIDAQRTTADEYDGEDVASVDVTVSDDDAPGVRVSPETLRIAEGGSGGYNVRLNTAPTADVTITVDSDNDDVTTQPSSLTFTPDDWSRAQRVTVNAGRDDDAADDTAMLSHRMSSGDGDYRGSSGVSVAVTVNDSDRPGVTVGVLAPSVVYEAGRLIERTQGEGDERVSITTEIVAEEHPSFYTVRLDTQPTGTVVIDLKSDNPDVTTVPDSLRFTQSNWIQTVRVEAVRDDGDKDDEKATITHTIDAQRTTADEYDTVTIPSLDVTVDDKDDPGVTLIVSEPPDGSEPLEVSKGADDGRKTATYQVVLDSQADGVIVVTVESSDPKKVSVAPSVLYFSGIQIDHGRTWPDWDEPQDVTVRALDDAAAGDTVTLIHKIADANAHGWDVPIGAEVGRVTVTVRE